ncbi:MAG: cryptochrome/photolyase family protein [Nitrospirota bacterium]
MKEAVVIFPNQLFDVHPAMAKNRKVFLLEDARFFPDFWFHKKKLILHRESMQAYRERIISKGYRVQYIECQKGDTDSLLFPQCKKQKIEVIYHAEITDHALEDRFQRNLKKHELKDISFPTPNFLTSADWLAEFLKKSSHYSLTQFYIAQRKRMNILVEEGKPAGGKWSFDSANRKKNTEC